MSKLDLGYDILKLPDKTRIEYLIREDSLIKDIIEKYSIEIINILLNLLNKVNRWNIPGLEKEIIESDKIHVIEMIYLTQKYFEIYPGLKSILNIEEIIIKIAIHDLGEVGVGDLSYNEKKSLSKENLEKHKKEEFNYALRLINTLKRTKLSKEQINKIQNYYIEYEKNKKNPNHLNDYFIKFIDIYQAFLHIIHHLKNLENLEEKPIYHDLQELKKYNKPFKELGIDLLYNFEKIMHNKQILKKDIIKILYN